MRPAPREDWKTRAHRYLKQLRTPRQRPFYRCGRCRRRKVLSVELWRYISPPRCCGGVHWQLDMDRYRDWKHQKSAYAVCRCGGSTWDAPHKPGSIIWCRDSKATVEEKEEAWRMGRIA